MKKHKSLFRVALIGLLGIVAISCQSKSEGEDDKVKHFRHIQFSETSFDIEKGIHPISAKEAKDINNYKFTYDDAGRLVEVAYCRDTVLLSYGSIRGAAKITYTYTDNQQIKKFFNASGEQVSQGSVYTEVYSLDENGVRTGMKFLNKEGEPVENWNKINYYVWTIMDNGWVKENRYNMAGEEMVMSQFCPFYELRFAYDEKGYVTSMMNYQGDTLYNCTAENCGDIGVSYFEFKNSEQGDLLSFSVHNTVGQLSNLYWGWAKRLNTVDENGYILESAVYDQDDEFVGGNSIPVTKTIYDEHGAVTETWNLDGERNLINHPNSGVAITAYTYDEFGQRTGTIQYDKDRVEIVKN